MATEFVFKDCPRSAGILLHITSLPTTMDLGDIGPAAYAFIDFLKRSGQSAWQILPLNPVTHEGAYSPYSATSSFAGNPLFISPELLQEEGLIDAAGLRIHQKEDGQKGLVDVVVQERMRTLWRAYQNRERLRVGGSAAFEVFCRQHGEWLNDYALFTLLHRLHGAQPWYHWPEKEQQHEETRLKELAVEHAVELDFIRWQQFLFDTQWRKLKEYARRQEEIIIIGDIPIYVAYDSADVWANRSFFSLDIDGRLKKLSGTPPDAFNPNGQRWGMPVYNWPSLKASDYDWFIQRLEKALTSVDLLRLDHFRGFAAYWEIDAETESAKNGRWVKGPGADLFDKVQQRLPGLPFIAEDLGHIDQHVYTLRDQFDLPGMEVLQFAFPKPEELNVHISHNHVPHAVIYTGTHDTNTMLGWFKELSAANRGLVNDYLDQPVTEENVAVLFVRMAYRSVSRLCIVPLQDILGLDETARMNNPAGPEGNWQWRASANALTAELSDRLLSWCRFYERMPGSQWTRFLKRLGESKEV